MIGDENLPAVVEEEDDDLQVLQTSEEQHRNLEIVLQRRGIAGIDPDSRAGRLISVMQREFMEAANQKLPQTLRATLTEQLISWILVHRSAMTHFMRSPAPSESASEKGKAKRQAFQLSITAMGKSSDAIAKLLKALGIAEMRTAGETLEDALKQLAAATAKDQDICIEQ